LDTVQIVLPDTVRGAGGNATPHESDAAFAGPDPGANRQTGTRNCENCENSEHSLGGEWT